MNNLIDFYNVFFFLLIAISVWLAWKISVADWRRRIIPDAYLFPMLLTGLIITAFFPWPIDIAEGIIAATFGYILSAFIGFIFNFVGHKKAISDTPIGMGDIKLISVGGIWLGATGLALALVFACISGIIWGRAKKQKFIPFAPFFLSGGILSLIAIAFLI